VQHADGGGRGAARGMRGGRGGVRGAGGGRGPEPATHNADGTATAYSSQSLSPGHLYLNCFLYILVSTMRLDSVFS
jgi:hypothetical protein